jgi:predicted MFS family arabinose efflux permease
VGWRVQNTVLLLFLVHRLGFSPVTIGLVGVGDGVAALLASLGVGRVTGRLGIGRTVIFGSFLGTASALVIPLAALVPPALPLPVILAAQMLAAIGVIFTTVPAVSLRQAVTPPELLGRVTAARRFLIFGLGLFGSVIGGFLGSKVGLLPTLFAAVPFILASSLVVLFSAVRTVSTASDALT